jgi:hypothetical protein
LRFNREFSPYSFLAFLGDFLDYERENWGGFWGDFGVFRLQKLVLKMLCTPLFCVFGSC